MKYIKLLFTVITMAITTALSAQNLKVTGVVTDSATGEGIPFAALMLKGTMTGTMSDADGTYIFEVPADGVIIFSSIGYKDLEIAVNGKTKIDAVLHPETESIEETIVVAFGTATKESFTGSASVVKSSDIAKTQSSDATRALEGVVAGVQMTTSSGSLGSSPSIRIRGTGSITAGNTPLYIVDGIPYSADMNNINPADIESMTVLKDAASNALYGARGANGVIMITTKKGKRGDAVVNVDAKWGLNTKALKSYDVITDPGQYYEIYYAAVRNYYQNPTIQKDGNGNTVFTPGMTPQQAHIKANEVMTGSTNGGGLGYIVYNVPEGQTLVGSNGRLNPNATLGRKMGYGGKEYYLRPDDWLDEAYNNSIRQEYNISVSGSTDKVSILASFGYLNNNGLIYGENMYRYTARLRADYQAKSWLKIGGNFGYTHSNWNNGNSSEGDGGSTVNIFSVASNIAPIYPLYIRNGNGEIMYDNNGYKMYDYGDYGNAGLYRPYMGNSNAIQAVYLDKNHSKANALNGSGFAEIKFLKDFTFTFNVGFGTQESRFTSIMNKYYGMASSIGGMISKANSGFSHLNLQQLLNWKKTFANVHNVAVLVGHENYNQTGTSLSASKSQMFSMDNDELNGAVVDGKSSSSGISTYNNEGYLVRAQYDYMNKIFASASFRRDASSRFHPDHRWGNFWSLGGGWILNYESWFPKYSWIDMIKLKASIGSQGNDSIGDYRYIDTYSLSNNEDKPAIAFGTKGNKEITWETNTNFNAGVDFDFLHGRVSGTVEYFYRKTTDMLFFFSTPLSIGYSGYYDNIGDMRNSGIEFSTNVNIMNRQNFNWSAYMNFTHYTNQVTMLPEEKKSRSKKKGNDVEGYEGYVSSERFIGEGLPLNTYYLVKYAGVNKETGEALWYQDITDENGKVVGKTTTTTYSEATQYLCGDPTPDLYGGFGTSLSFYGFDVAVAFTYSIGGLAYDSSYAAFMSSPNLSSIGTNFHKDILDSWSQTNKDSDIPRHQFLDQYTSATSDRFLIDASYLNFQNAQIGYTFPERISKKMRINSLRLYLSCDNIIYWSRRQGLDTRASFSGATTNATSSPVRTISGGLNITF